jgi:hypothetical protein
MQNVLEKDSTPHAQPRLLTSHTRPLCIASHRSSANLNAIVSQTCNCWRSLGLLRKFNNSITTLEPFSPSHPRSVLPCTVARRLCQPHLFDTIPYHYTLSRLLTPSPSPSLRSTSPRGLAIAMPFAESQNNISFRLELKASALQ